MNVEGLLPHQVEPAHRLIDALSIYRAALDASEKGAGKTFVAGAVVRHLDLPTLCIVPKISITSWKRALEHLGTGACVKGWESIRTGNTPYGSWQFHPPAEREKEYHCTSCQCVVSTRSPTPCRLSPSGIHCIEAKTKEHNYGRFTFYEGIKFIVWDECQMAAGLDSLNADMVLASKRQNIPSLFLSATAAGSPLQLRALGFALGLHCLTGPGGFYPWAMRHRVRRPVWGGLEFYGSDEQKKQVMSKIHSDLFPSRGVRVRISDIPNFPKCDIRAELYDLESSGKINDLYAEMDESISLLNAMKLTDRCAEHPLTALLRASQAIELLKVPMYQAIHASARESGYNVAIFVCFRQTLIELQKRLKCGTIYGGQNSAERQRNLDDFQANKTDTLVLNIAAGGVSISLHDLLGKPRFGICSLHQSAIKMNQCLGRLARAGGLSPAIYRIPLVAGTVEEKTHRRLVSKLNAMDAFNDADVTACNLPLISGNLAKILDENLH